MSLKTKRNSSTQTPQVHPDKAVFSSQHSSLCHAPNSLSYMGPHRAFWQIDNATTQVSCDRLLSAVQAFRLSQKVRSRGIQ